MFVDQVKVKLEAGKGGDGALSFHHEKFIDKGGPDGGDGGDGGDIILRATRNENTLASFRYKKLLKAEDGQPGFKNKRHGKSAKDLEVAVPIGTVVTDTDGNVVADLIEDGQTAVIASGGKGGFGNAHFISSTRQAPRIAEKGEAGEEIEVQLEIKMIADVGLVGLPNAGKSTLLSVISNARPEIANYAFTTLSPNLGVVDVDGKTSLLVADIPGLIEGASRGKGLGDEFLRHIERTKVILHLIDIYNNDVTVAYKTIMDELRAYRVDLSKKPQIIALTKVEGVDEEILQMCIDDLKKVAPRGTLILPISSSAHLGIKELLRQLLAKVNKSNERSIKDKLSGKLPIITFKGEDSAWTVTKSDNGYLVTGKRIEKFAARTRFGDYHNEGRLKDIMKKMGIMHELRRQGIEPGQNITIGKPPKGKIEY
jgi:GTP-binding protein